MKTPKDSVLFFLCAVLIVMVAGCSSTSNLRKFDEGDMSKEISEDIAKKFEVKDAAPVNVVVEPAKVAETEASKKLKKKFKVDSKTGLDKSLDKNQGKMGSLQPPTRRKEPMSFSMGEKLQYDIRYLGVTAGYLDIEVQSLKEVNSRKVYRLVGTAKTTKFFELVYRVDDNIESFWDYDGLYSHRFSMNLDESKQTRKLIELYDYEKNKSYYWDRVDHVEKGLSEKKEQHDIKPWSQDVLSAMYYVRLVDLPKDTSSEVRFPVVLDGKAWETVITFDKKGTLYAGGQNFNANIYKLVNYENGVLKNKDTTLWLSDDAHRYILRVEAKVRVGSFAVALEKVL